MGRSSESQIRRIVFIGAECTGKSTLAQAVAQRFGEPYSGEYVRRHAASLDRPLDIVDLEPIAKGQLLLEDEAAARAENLVFHDTNLLSSILYAEHYFNTHIYWVDEVFRKRAYHTYFLCQPDFPWEADPGQRASPEERALLQGLFVESLKRYCIPYVELAGSLEQRLAIATRHLERFQGEE